MEPENQVRLRWTSHQWTLLSMFDELLSTESMVDVTLACDSQYVRAHKVVLSACSPYLQELLGLDGNKSTILFLKDVKYSELTALIQFMYRGEVNISESELPSFLAVAQALKIRGLAEVGNANNSTISISADASLPSHTITSNNINSNATSSTTHKMDQTLNLPLPQKRSRTLSPSPSSLHSVGTVSFLRHTLPTRTRLPHSSNPVTQKQIPQKHTETKRLPVDPLDVSTTYQLSNDMSSHPEFVETQKINYENDVSQPWILPLETDNVSPAMKSAVNPDSGDCRSPDLFELSSRLNSTLFY